MCRWGVSSNGRELHYTWLRKASSIYHRLLTADTIENIQKLLHKDPILLLDEIKEWLALYHD